ncbi:unnamed protein product [Calypogeia fissa]
MATKSMAFWGLLLAAVAVHTVVASDPDLTVDFNVSNPVASDFMGSTTAPPPPPQGQGMANPFPVTITGLSGLGLIPVLFEFGPMSQIDPHTHPRATEVFYVLSGSIDVGFVDTNNDLFEITVNTGDIFVFPKGLLHWQRNNGAGKASGYSVLNSENPGTLLIVKGLFTASGKGLPDIVLATALGIGFNNVDKQIDNIKQAVAKKDNVTLVS